MAWGIKAYWVDGSNVDLSADPPSAGDILLAGVVSDSTSTTGVGPGTGWTQIGAYVVNTVDAQTVGVWKKDAVAVGGETSISFTTSTVTLSWVLAVSGADQTTHFDVAPPTAVNLGSSGSGVASPAVATLAITTVSNGSLLIAIKGTDNLTGGDVVHTFSDTAGSSWSTVLDVLGGSFRNCGIGAAEQAAAGATTVSGTSTWAMGGNAGHTMFVLALRNVSPPAGGDPDPLPPTMPPLAPPGGRR